MKHHLALWVPSVVTALVAPMAAAQTKFELKIGGDYLFEAGYTSQNRDQNLRTTEMLNRIRLVITPVAKADNGLEYGARVRLLNSSDPTFAADRAYLFASGSFGEVRLGQTNTFNDVVYATAPMDYMPLTSYDRIVNYVGPNNGQQILNGRYSGADFKGGIAGTVRGSNIIGVSLADSNATKVEYFSPRIAGLQLGASYTPRSDSSNTDVQRVEINNAATSAVTGVFGDTVEIGANYDRTFSGVNIQGSASHLWGTAIGRNVATDHYKDLRAWQAGLQVEYAGLAAGGSYTYYGKSGQNEIAGNYTESTRTWTAGVQYSFGRYIVGANYKYGQDPGSITVRGKRKVDVYEFGAAYTVAPGLMLQAQYDHYVADSDKSNLTSAGSADDEGNVALVRTVLKF